MTSTEEKTHVATTRNSGPLTHKVTNLVRLYWSHFLSYLSLKSSS